MPSQNGSNFSLVVPLTKVVKALLIINIGIWLFLEVILEHYILHAPVVSDYLALVPLDLVDHFFIWQPVTYMFLHAVDITHILFNMLMLWWVGSELEQHLGSRFFLTYYLTCGVGAALLYSLILIVYGLITHNPLGWQNPVIGASGAIFGLLVAYGMLFGERVIYFMMLFPMKAKHFVMILGGILIANLLSEGLVGSDGVAHLAHLGGAVTGYLFMKGWSRYQRSSWRTEGGRSGRRGGRRLKLVVNNKDSKSKNEGPRYWN